jgi:hypothetical protein
MRVVRSRLGWTLVAVYAIAFLAAYIHAIRNRGVFLYDIWLDLLSIPYILVGRLLTQNRAFEVHAHEPWGLVPAVIFCSAIVLLLGAALEHGIRRLIGGKTES